MKKGVIFASLPNRKLPQPILFRPIYHQTTDWNHLPLATINDSN